jgi:enamine deaminase RidA (YjgF/YER057c/UK114 family)
MFLKKNINFKLLFNFKKMNSSKIYVEPLDSSKTPKAIGPYSKGTRVEMGDKYMIFTAGFIGADPESGNLVSDDVTGQTKQALDNLKNFLEYNFINIFKRKRKFF